MCGQSWRVQLDYGLQNSEISDHEAMLVVAPSAVLQRLINAATDSQQQLQQQAVAVLSLNGYNEDGLEKQALTSWRKLSPSVSLLSPDAAAR